MKKILALLILLALILVSAPGSARAEGGVFASGGGTKQTGQTFTITVAASGADFDSLQGSISVSGPVDVVSFSPGGATWLPGKTPTNGGQFVGICSPTSSLTVASIKLRAKAVGSGSVSVGGVKLARNGVVTGTVSGSASFTIQKAPDLPDAITVTSSSHPDSNQAYEATTIILSWNREKGVDNFSYVLDQVENTTPATKSTSSDTSATFENKAVGTYWFHIRAHNTDGWSGTTNFKINIKEPDAKIDATLSKPSEITISKASDFKNNIKDGTVSGIIISGVTIPDYTANIAIDPALTLPSGKQLSTSTDTSGKFELLIDFPIKAGSYVLTVQGQKDKTLTPVSDSIRFEISQEKGGAINLITEEDADPPAPVSKKWYEKFNLNRNLAFYAASSLIVLIILGVVIVVIVRTRRLKKVSALLKR